MAEEERSARRVAGAARSEPEWSRMEIAALLLPVIGCALAALAIGQDANFDLFNYHYYDPYAFLHSRLAVDVIPASLQSYLNPIIDLPFYFLINHVPPRVEAMVVGGVQGTNLVLVYLITRRVAGSRVLGAAAVVAAGVAGGFASELGNSMGDTIVSIPILAGVLAAIAATARRGGPGESWRWAVAGALVGLGAGLKLSELEVGIALPVAALAVGGPLRRRVRRLLASGIAELGGLLAAAGYWTVHLWLAYGDPLVFDASSVSLFPTRYLPKAAAKGRGFLPANLLDAAFYPVYWLFHPLAVAEIPLRELSVPLAYVLVMVLVALLLLGTLARAVARVGRRRVPAEGTGRAATTRPPQLGPLDPRAGFERDADAFLVVLFAVSIAVFVKQLGVYRYLIPIELLSPVVVLSAGRLIAQSVAAGLTPAAARRGLRSHARRDRRGGAASSARFPGRGRLAGTGFLAACAACAATAYPANYWIRVPFGRSFFDVPTPAILRGERTDAVLQVGEQPLAFIYPRLPSRIIAIGLVNNIIEPTYVKMIDERAELALRAGGGVFLDFVGSYSDRLETPPGTEAYLAEIGLGGWSPQACEVDRTRVGAVLVDVTFCRLSGPLRRLAAEVARGG